MSARTRAARRVLALPFKLVMWAGVAYVTIAGLVMWVRFFGLLGLLFGGTLIPDLALPLVVYHSRTGHWPGLYLLAFAAAIVCGMIAGILNSSEDQ